jgi:hypothetical protein
LKETGYKPEKSGNFLNKKNKEEGYYKFSGVALPELAQEQLDLYFKVDPMENQHSSITLLVSKGYDNFISTSDSAIFNASQNFLNSFVQKTNVYNINQKMDEQKKALVTSEKKWSDVRDRQAKAKTKIVELEAEIKSLQKEEILRQEETERLQSELRDLEAQRTSAQK